MKNKPCINCGSLDKYKDGSCRPCRIRWSNEYRAKNLDRVKQQQAKRYKENREEIRSRRKPYSKEEYAAYYAKNAEKISLRLKEYYLANAEEMRKKARKYYALNTEIVINKMKLYRMSNPEYSKINNNKRRAAKVKSGGSHTIYDIKQLFKLQKMKCACCKVSIKNGYHADHIIPLSKGGSNSKENIQLLCAPCNLKKSAKHPVDFMQEMGFLI